MIILRHKVNIWKLDECVFLHLVKTQALFWHTRVVSETLCRSKASCAFFGAQLRLRTFYF